MTEQPRFTIRVDQNKYLPTGGEEVHAILTVETADAPRNVLLVSHGLMMRLFCT